MVICECGKKFKNKAGLNSHKNWCEKVSSQNISYEKINCPKCGISMCSYNLKNHLGSKKCKKNLRRKKAGKIQTDKKCDYGCGKKANWLFKNEKLCCSKNVAKCEAVGNKISQSNLENNRTREGEVWNKGLTKDDHPSIKSQSEWRKGKTYEEIYGKEKAKKIKSKISKASKNRKSSWEIMNPEERKQAKKKLRKSINRRYEEGWQPKAGRCETFWYESDIAG